MTWIFVEKGKPSFGFLSLGFLYVAFTISNLFAAKLMSSLGLKKLMILGTLAYSLYIGSLIFSNLPLVLLLSVVLGVGAALLWNAQGVYLVKVASTGKVGAASGFFSSIMGLGTFTGILSVGWLLDLEIFPRHQLFLLLSFLPLVGILLLTLIKPIEIKGNSIIKMSFLKKIAQSRTLLKLSLLWVLMVFVQTYSFSVLPLLIARLLGVGIAGLLGSLFALATILFAFSSGSLSDRIGRLKVLSIGVLLFISGAVLLLMVNKFTLVLASILLAIGFAILRGVTFALVGDISSTKLLPTINAFQYILMNLGVVSVIILGGFGWFKFLGILMIALSLATVMLAIPILRQSLPVIRGKIEKEILC